MQKSISKAATTWRLILSGFIIISLISCEEPNSVGGQFIEGSNLRYDTLYVDDFTELNESIYSGNLRYAPIGEYDDPLFGKSKAISYIKPRISSLNFQDSVDENYQLKLELNINTNLSTGNLNEQVNFDVFPVSEFWRGNNVFSDDVIGIDSSKSYGTFTHTDEDSVVIDLSEELLLELAAYINDDSDNIDSLYNYEFFGLAIVAREGDGRIISPDMFNSRFLIISGDQDTTRMNFQSHAFTIETTNANTFNNRLYINSFYSNFYKMSFESAIPEYEKLNLLKAEFMVYEDDAQLQNSITSSQKRNDVEFLELKTAEVSDLTYNLQFSAVEYFGSKDSLSKAFKFVMTDYINQYLYTDQIDNNLYFNISPGGGVMRSTLLYDNASNDSLKPKLILTFSE